MPIVRFPSARHKAISEVIVKNAITALKATSMVKSVTLRDVASYDHEGVTFSDLQKVNFIYGGNGCGKTTFSRVMTSKYLRTKYPHCTVEWTGPALKVLAYNKDFRERNLQENIPGVFTLGEDSIAAEKKLDKLRDELDTQNKSLASKQKRIEARDKQIKSDNARLEEWLWKNVRDNFKDFRFYMDRVNRKAQFARRITELVEQGSYRKAKSPEEVWQQYNDFFNTSLAPAFSLMAVPEEEFAELTAVTDNEIWQRSIVASGDVPIANMIKRLGLEDWVRHGIRAMEHDSDVCPFCQQHTITSNLRHELEDFFDEQYRKDMNSIRLLIERYGLYSERLLMAVDECLQLSGIFPSHPLPGLAESRATFDTLKERLETNRRIMIDKLNNPGMAASFKEIRSLIDTLWVFMESANKALEEHNRVVKNLDLERNRLESELWNCMAAQSAETVKFYRQTIKLKDDDMRELMKEEGALLESTRKLTLEIKELEKKVASIQPTVDRINITLKKTGFTGFSIQPSKHGSYYQIQRQDGTLVKDTLSEGEVTFITFLYFMQLVGGGESKNVVHESKVLVIDDPISSLDDNVMGVVCEMLRTLVAKVRKDEMKGVNQVFILTHNQQFHKEITAVNARSRRQRDCHHWVLYKEGNVSRLTAHGMDNPIRSGYEQLWRDLKESRKDSLTLRNNMRRIIEDYFTKFGGYERSQLIEEFFADDPVDKMLIKALFKWIDEGSHGSDDDLYVEAPQVSNQQYMEHFRLLFVKTGHEAHYKMMMRL